MQAQQVEQLMTLPQAADFIGRSRSTLRSAVDRGKLPLVGRIGRSDGRGGIIVVAKREVERYAERNGIDLTQK